MEHPKAIGDRSTLAIMIALTESGRDVFVPFGENTRVDLVISDPDRLARVQCKRGGSDLAPWCSRSAAAMHTI